MMHLEIIVPEEYLSAVIADLSKRRTIIKYVGMRGLSKVLCQNAMVIVFYIEYVFYFRKS